MKKIVLAAALFLTLSCLADDTIQEVQFEIRDYDAIELAAGTFIPVMNTSEISTRNCPEGFKTMFIAANDLYLNDTNVVPANTAFYGLVEELHEPVIGTNGSMKIRIIKMVYPDGFETAVRGYIYSVKDNILGGDMTAPVKYEKMPHYQSRYYPLTLQLRPGRERKMGVHTTLRAGEEKLIILTDPVWITHTLTD